MSNALRSNDEWSGRFVLMDDGDQWLVVAVERQNRPFILAIEKDKESALEIGRHLSAERIRSFLPERRYFPGAWDESAQLRSLGAYFDGEVESWYIPENCISPELEARRKYYSEKATSEIAKLVKQRATEAEFPDRITLDVPYRDVECVRKLGSVFNPIRKNWFISRKGPLKPFEKWLPKHIQVEDKFILPGFLPEHTWIRVSYEDEYLAKSFGALYLKERKLWVAPEGCKASNFEPWMKVPSRISPRKSFSTMLLNCGYDPILNQNLKIIVDGNPHRFYVEGDSGKASGEYAIYLENPNPAGWIRNYRTRQLQKWAHGYLGDYRSLMHEKAISF